MNLAGRLLYLDHTAIRATEPVLGLAGTRDNEPEIALAELERQAQRGEAAFLAYLQEQTGRSVNALKKAWAAPLDVSRAKLLRAACGNDEALYARVLPFAGLIRDDDYGRPVVIPAGSVYVTSGAERRSTGTHYTPRSLTEPIVLHTLEPLVYIGPAEGKPREEWQLHPATDLLRLTVCDMAMGSGAFLVQACRYLSERLLEAWATAEGAGDDKRRLITAEGFLTINSDEAIPADPDERLVSARRLVADRCLYGVDKNPLAVEMAKLSLWLITLAKGQPFTFLDHALRSGDSLLGISDIGQLTHWSLDKGDGIEPRQTTFITQQVEEALEVALRERRKIAGTHVREARDADLKAGWLATADAALALVKLGADLLVAAMLHPNPKQREGLRKDWLGSYSLLLSAAEETRAGRLTVGGQADVTNRAAYAALRHEADDLLAGRKPFHWSLEFPEVFADRSGFSNQGLGEAAFDAILTTARGGILSPKLDTLNPGFAAMVGNPPFLGGTRISTTHGEAYLYALQQLYPSFHGRADMCALFFIRGFHLLRVQGDLGLLATNTIAQGDTREAGFDNILDAHGEIFRAISSTSWPGSAAVTISIAYITKGRWIGYRWLNAKEARYISSHLDESDQIEKPRVILKNSGICFQGSKLDGIGFVIDANEAANLLSSNPKNKDVLFKYISGKDLNEYANTASTRWVINFGEMSLLEAEGYPECLKIVKERVYPYRQTHKEERTRNNWWRFQRTRSELYENINKMSWVIGLARVSKYVILTFISKGYVYSEKVVVIALNEMHHFAVLQSNIHESWAWQYSSTMRDAGINYAPTDCFETFAFPAISNSQLISTMTQVGEQYYRYRRGLVDKRCEGLTSIYNRFHDRAETSTDIAELRRLHVAMDQAVAAAYGWADLDLGHGFHTTKQGLRYTISEAARRTVLDRLLALNHERYAEEVRQGLHDKGAKKAAGKGKRTVVATPSSIEAPQLVFDFGDAKPVVPPQEGTVIDFDAAVLQRAAKKAAETQVEYNTTASVPSSAQLSPLDRHVILLARAIQLHEKHRSEKTLGHVKAEKIAHLVEAKFEVELGRTPVRDAAGPVDFPHLQQVLAQGKVLEAFEDRLRPGKQLGYTFEPRHNLELTAKRLHEAFGTKANAIDKFVESLVGLNTDQTEIIATLYAVWNDLLANGEVVDDDQLLDAFYAWHPDKVKFQPNEVRIMKLWMLGDGIVPTGRAKRTRPL